MRSRHFAFSLAIALAVALATPAVVGGQTCGAPGCDWEPGDMLTFSQFQWGDPSSAAATIFGAHYNTVYANGLTVGISGSGGFSMLFTVANAVLAYLPAAGTAGPLTFDLVDPLSSSSGVFGGDVVALALNVDYSDAGHLPGASHLGDLRICGLSALPVLNGMSVRQFLATANSLLGGGTGPITVDEASSVAVAINAAFLDGSPNAFAQQCLVNPGAADLTCDGIDNDCDGTVDPPSCVCVENAPGLAGWWRGDGTADDGAAGNHGTLMGGAGYAAGRVGQAFSLNGTTAYVANLGDAYSYAFIENTVVFTINAWIKLNDANALGQGAITASTATQSEKGHYFIWENSAGQQQLNLALMKANPSVPVLDASTPDHVITDNGWHHVAAVGNGLMVTFYVDGVAYPGGGTLTAKPTGPSIRAVDAGWCPYPTPLCMFNGMIDELQIHDRALSAGQVRAIYQAGANGMCGTGCAQNVPGLVGWWPGSGDAGDRSASNNHGTPGGGATFASGKVGQAFWLGGTGYVDVPDNSSLEFPTQFTLAAWIRPYHTNNSSRIISKWGAGNYAYGMLFSSNNDLQPRADISNDGVNYDALVSPSSLSVGVWAHVATTFNLGTLKLYVNGSEVASMVSAMTTIFASGSSPLSIGRVPLAGNNFVGLIDEPMVFNRALSPVEIQTLYEAGASGLCGLGTVVAVDDPVLSSPPLLGLQLLAPRPNPARASVELGFRLADKSRVTLEVFDVAGRHVRTVARETLGAGLYSRSWDGRDASGSPVPAGIYLLKLRAGAEFRTQNIVVAK